MLMRDLNNLADKYNFLLDSLSCKINIITDNNKFEKLISQYSYTQQAYNELKALQTIQAGLGKQG